MATIAFGAAGRQRGTATRASSKGRAWFDPRVAIGLVLVLASVLGVVGIVAASDRTVTVYTAAAPLAAGSRVDSSDLVASRARLGSAQSLYLAGSIPAAGYVTTRNIPQGEMIPLSALGTTAGVDTASTVVTLASALPMSVVAGSTVDLWSAPKTANSTFGPPAVLVSGATVVRILPAGGLIANSAVTVEVRVPKASVASVLEAVAGGDAISAVGVGEAVHR